MKINNSGYNYNKNNVNFGLNIYGSMATTKLKTFFVERGLSEKNYFKFLDKVRNLADDNFSLRFARFREGNNIDKPSTIEYVLTAQKSAINGNDGYIKIRNKSVIKIKNLTKKLSDDITSLKAKLTECPSVVQPDNVSNNVKSTNIFKRFIAKIFNKIKS